MPGTSKATLITDTSAADQDSQSLTVRPPVTLPAEHLIEAARSRLRTELAQHNDGDVPEIIERAVDRAIEWHAGQARKSGEPYVVHPIEVAILLSRMSADTEAIIAALLHDVVEDSAISLDTVREEFGDRVAALVDGVTKLGQIQWTGEGDQATRERAVQAENLRKMFLAMIDDIGVVLIKLADRLHNMRTLDHMSRDKQVQIAQQTMEIYAPLANRLGIWQFKSELEDLAFRYLQPEAYKSIKGSLEVRGRDQAGYIARVMKELKDAIQAEGIDVELTGRTKHIYSVFRKMRQK